jgi:hypothetical protein
MQPCDSCKSCSFPERVEYAKQHLPAIWLEELADLDADDNLYVAALAEFDTLSNAGKDIPFSLFDTKVSGI